METGGNSEGDSWALSRALVVPVLASNGVSFHFTTGDAPSLFITGVSWMLMSHN